MREPGLQPGIYYLRNAADPSPLVGVDPGSRRVVTHGYVKKWEVTRVGDERYTLTVVGFRQIPLSIEDQGGNLVGEPDGVPTVWHIPGPEGGPYTIRVDRPIRPPIVWTVREPSEPGSPVTLQALHEVLPTPENQKWYFVPPPPE